MVPQLIALTEGPDIVVDKPILLLGRHQECDVQIPSRKISRRHCCIAQVDQHLVIRDLFSTNGIRINGTKLSEGILRDGDEVTIGNFDYRVECTEARPELNVEGSVKAKPEASTRGREDAAISLDNPVVIFDASDSAPIGLPIVLPVNKDPLKKPGFSDDVGFLPMSDSHSS
ncbi:MAG: FHA domain-containing protein [Gemmataceae bacterium]|nr:FHA domain-containing protein [Gemmataceae bacterium]